MTLIVLSCRACGEVLEDFAFVGEKVCDECRLPSALKPLWRILLSAIRFFGASLLVILSLLCLDGFATGYPQSCLHPPGHFEELHSLVNALLAWGLIVVYFFVEWKDRNSAIDRMSVWVGLIIWQMVAMYMYRCVNL